MSHAKAECPRCGLEFRARKKKRALSCNGQSAGSPSYQTLYDFYSSTLNLYVEGVEFMDHEEIFQAVKKDVFNVANKQHEARG